MRATVFCTFRVSGFHCWPNAPAQYAYLGQLHRHEFHVRVEVRVGHGNRDVEFIELKQTASAEFEAMSDSEHAFDQLNYGGRSCEMLADELAGKLLKDFDVVAVEVSEDGENGARFQR
jgi:hypothetical protein